MPRGKMVCQSNKAEFLKSREGKFQCCRLTQLVPRIFRKPLRMPRPMVPMLEVRFPCGYNSERSWWMPDPYHGWRKEFLLPWHTLGLWEASRVAILIIDLHEKPIEGQHTVLERFRDLPSGRGIFLQASATFTVKALGIFHNPIVKMHLAPQEI